MNDDQLILLIEDNPNDAELTMLGFKRNHIQHPILHLKSGVEALNYLFGVGKFAHRDVTKLPHAIVLDLQLPKVSGLEVLETIRTHALTQHIPVIVLTSAEKETDTSMCLALGVSAYLQKPIDFLAFSKLVTVIAGILNRLNREQALELVANG